MSCENAKKFQPFSTKPRKESQKLNRVRWAKSTPTKKIAPKLKDEKLPDRIWNFSPAKKPLRPPNPGLVSD